MGYIKFDNPVYADHDSVINPVTGKTLTEERNTIDVGFEKGKGMPKLNIVCEQITADADNNTLTLLTTSQNSVGVIKKADIGMSGTSVDTDGTVHCDMHIEVEGQGYSFELPCAISLQGQVSLNHPKKNFAIDFLDKVKFGEWLSFDAFHLKGFWTDWLHSRDYVANAIVEQMYMSKSIDERRPYMAYNDFSNDIRQRADMGALCHVDGFPCELYINGTYWGVYTWRQKKDRANYMLTKNNSKHIMLDFADESTDNFDWTKVEIRNPKNVTNADGTKYDGDNPQEIADGDTKTYILNWCSALKNATTKEAFEACMNVDALLDYYVFVWFTNNWDSFDRNTLWTTWDGEHFSPLAYDLDGTFGAGTTKSTDDYSINMFASNYNTMALRARNVGTWVSRFESLYDTEIKARYANYRSNGVFTLENVVELFDKFSQLVGYEAYNRDVTRWAYPCNGNGSNASYDSISRIKTYMEERITFLDSKFGYTA